VCIKEICSDVPIYTSDECDCQELCSDFNIQLLIYKDELGNAIMEANPVGGYDSYMVKWREHLIDVVVGTARLYGGAGLCDPQAGTFNQVNPHTVQIIASRDGCNYDSTFYIEDPCDEVTEIKKLDIVGCDCEEVEPKNCEGNRMWFNVDCNEETGDIVVTTGQSFLDVIIESDERSDFVGNGFLEVWRRVTFAECDPLEIRQVITCNPLVSCDNSATLDYTLIDSVFTLISTENINSAIASDSGIEVSINGADFEPYSAPITLEEGDTVVWQRIIVFDDSCSDIRLQGSAVNTVEVMNDPDPEPDPDCLGYDDYSLDIVYDEETSVFTINKTGDESILTTNKLLWRIGGSDPWDKNESGIPYFSPVKGDGVMVAGWKIVRPDCDEEIIYATAHGCRKIAVKAIPVIELSLPDGPLKICQVDCAECGCTFNIECIDCMATIINTDGCEGFTFQWFDPNGVLVDVGLGPVMLGVEGMYNILVTSPDGLCSESVQYYYDKPEAGDPIGDPIQV
jgi:hypothetical protein